MKEWSRKKRWLIGLACLFGLPLIGMVLIGFLDPFGRHQHCMKQTGLTLVQYALEHQGEFPYHTNGFGDALVLALKETGVPHKLVTAPGDDGTWLLEFIQSGADVPEERCTRAYVQGLSRDSNPEIALIFDRYPTRGGDHSRSPWGPKLRDVSMVAGDHGIIKEHDWPEFARNQIDLLVAEGITRNEAEKYYQLPAK